MLSRQASLGRRAAGTAARPLGLTAAVALCAAAVFFAAGCGERGSADSSSTAASTSVTVTLDVDGSGGADPQEAHVTCPGDDACDLVEKLTPADLAPTKPTQPCTEIFGGPEVVTIQGQIAGDGVDASFDRSNGCEINRFGHILPLVQALFPDYKPGGALAPQ